MMCGMDTTLASLFIAAALGATLHFAIDRLVRKAPASGPGLRGRIKWLLTERPVTNWLRRTVRHWADLLHPVIDVVDRLWRFWTPRFTDRNFIVLVVSNTVAIIGYVMKTPGEVVLFGVHLTPETQDVIVLGLWAIFNALAEPWQKTGANDKLPPSRIPRPAPEPVNPHGGPPMVDQPAAV